jgi:hypothetical protein
MKAISEYGLISPIFTIKNFGLAPPVEARGPVVRQGSLPSADENRRISGMLIQRESGPAVAPIAYSAGV